MIYELIILKE